MQTEWAIFCEAVSAANERATLLPVQRTVGAGYAVQADMVVAIPVPLWEAVMAALAVIENGDEEQWEE